MTVSTKTKLILTVIYSIIIEVLRVKKFWMKTGRMGWILGLPRNWIRPMLPSKHPPLPLSLFSLSFLSLSLSFGTHTLRYNTPSLTSLFLSSSLPPSRTSFLPFLPFSLQPAITWRSLYPFYLSSFLLSISFLLPSFNIRPFLLPSFNFLSSFFTVCIPAFLPS